MLEIVKAAAPPRQKPISQHRTLVLNKNNRPFVYPPLILNAQQTAIALMLGRVEVVEMSESYLMGHNYHVMLPKVVRLRQSVARSLFRKAAFSPRALLIRDRNTCQYTGNWVQFGDGDINHAATVEHVLPRAQGGENTWENTVIACYAINNFKGNRTPEEAGLTLRIRPWVPTMKDMLHLWLTDPRQKDTIQPEWQEHLKVEPTDTGKRMIDLALAA